MNRICLLLFFPLGLASALDLGVPHFEEYREEVGLDLRVISGGPEKKFLLESVGGGLGVIDYDNDGWLDLYVVNGGTLEGSRTRQRQVRNALFRNQGDGTFRDVTREAGVPGDHWGKGVLVADLDQDGFDDLYLTNFGPNILYRNNGDGTFSDVTRRAGVGDPRWSSAAAAADYDGDGWLDLFVVNYLEYDLDYLPVEGKFCSYLSLPVACGPRGLKGAGDTLYRNNGDGTFTEASREAGVADEAGFYGLGAVWGDFDDDGDLDLFVANDSTPNYLYRNDGGGGSPRSAWRPAWPTAKTAGSRPAWGSTWKTTTMTAGWTWWSPTFPRTTTRCTGTWEAGSSPTSLTIQGWPRTASGTLAGAWVSGTSTTTA